MHDVRITPYSLALSILSLVAFTAAVTRADDDLPGELSGKDRHKTRFVTEPDYFPTYFSIREITESPTLLASGYLFLDPVHGAATRGVGGDQLGPQIREQDGTLVWYGGETEDFRGRLGDDAPTRLRVQDFHVCDYLGHKGKHLCWSELTHPGRRKKIIVDSSYKLVEKLIVGYELEEGGRTEYGDLHEFNVVDNGTNFLQPLAANRAWDLSVLGMSSESCVVDGCLQDVSIKTKETNFAWCILDHLPVWETTIFPTNGPNITGNVTSPKIGSGATFLRDWSHLPDICYDAFHVNSIDKNAEGDYLFSVRHNNQILKIAGPDNVHGLAPGIILWRLDGAGGNITFEEGFVPFGRQHDVRYVNTTAEETILTLFNNAWEGALAPTGDYASGMIISVNNVTNTARLLNEYEHPHHAVAPSQGAVQLLPNGNTFVAWGSLSQFSEYTHDGQLLLHATYTNRTEEEDLNKAKDTAPYYTYSYRLFKSPWVGKPTWQPKLITYTKDCSSTTQLMAWVSWNGATEVHSWRFFISNYPDGLWVLAGDWPRTGYETEANLSEDSLLGRALQQITFPRFVAVQGLDQAKQVLPNGDQMVETFVPKPKMRKKNCTPTGCFEEVGFDYDLDLSCGDTCSTSLIPHFCC